MTTAARCARSRDAARPDANGSIDRLTNDHSVGYVLGNVHVVCGGCNARKRTKTVEELAAGAAGEDWQRCSATGYPVSGFRVIYHEPVCPDCGSFDITEEEVETGEDLSETAHICRACGTAWPLACVTAVRRSGITAAGGRTA